MLSRGQTARPFQNTSTPFLFPSFLIEAGYTNIVASRAGAEEGHVFAGFLYFYFQFSNFHFFRPFLLTLQFPSAASLNNLYEIGHGFLLSWPETRG